MLPETRKENKITVTEKKPNVNPYYLVISGRFKAAKYVTLCVLVVFLLATVILFRDEITIDNLKYLIKDFEMGDNINSALSSTITFDSDLQVDLELYKGDLVIAGSSNFYLCDLQGNKRLNEDSMFSNPVVLSGKKYLLVYGLSEYTYSIYTTFSQVHTEQFDYPISGAAMSDKGLYAIVTRSAKYRSVVYLYNENFERIGVISKDKYIMDVQFNDDGTELLITSVYSEGGNFCSEMVTYVPYSDKPKKSTVLNGAIPLKTGYVANNGYSVVFDDRIAFYDSNSELVGTYKYPSGIVPITTELCGDHVSIVYSENIVGDDIRVVVLDSIGNAVLSADINGQPKKVRLDDNFVYVLLDGKVCKINISDGSMKYYDIEKNALELLIVNQNLALAGYSNHTSRVVMD